METVIVKREASKAKTSEQEIADSLRRLDENFGKFKPKNNLTDEEIREKVSRELMREYGFSD